MSSRCACDRCSLSLCSGVRVADECKRWNTHFSSSVVSYFLQNFQLQHRCLLNPSPAGRKSSHFHGWLTYTQRELKWSTKLNVLGLPCVELSTGINHSSHLYPLEILHRKRYNGKKRQFKKFGLQIVDEHFEKFQREKRLSTPCCPPPVLSSISHTLGTEQGHSSSFWFSPVPLLSAPQHSAQRNFQLRKYLPSTITQLWSWETNVSVTILWAQNK